MTPALPTELLPLASLVFLLGIKHGLDADHLATIDGLTRFNQTHHPQLAARCGLLFSLGHGTMVMSIALLVASMAQNWTIPNWLDALGLTISVFFLILLGGANLWRAIMAGNHQIHRPIGLKTGLLGRWFECLTQTSHPALIAAIGALFALSFDTMSQAALFAATANRLGGIGHALALGLLFTLGMLLSDGLNGWWLSRLLERADLWAAVAARVMGGVIGLLSLLLAVYALLAHHHDDVMVAMRGHEYWLSVVMVLVLLIVLLVMRVVAWRQLRL
ncbi:nickel transporter [Ampullimonas aquatilis]|uniref:HoxN/HupN/NixA family nickel/cobalt transporter n=1 Tax=Ampullimonas aquatilis TaxID=1341549 RepID=UPI003C752086